MPRLPHLLVVIARAPGSTCCVVEFMNHFCHGEERSDTAIHLDFSWIATPDFVGLAMTNNRSSFAGGGVPVRRDNPARIQESTEGMKDEGGRPCTRLKAREK